MSFKARIDVFGAKEIKGSGVNIITGWIPYEKVVCLVRESNCILELIQEGQHGPSLRYFEAICYNKKLLTNNPNIINFPYYNSNYMHIFQNPEDIDINWVTKKEIVDYQYKGDFSPNNLVNKILYSY